MASLIEVHKANGKDDGRAVICITQDLPTAKEMRDDGEDPGEFLDRLSRIDGQQLAWMLYEFLPSMTLDTMRCRLTELIEESERKAEAATR